MDNTQTHTELLRLVKETLPLAENNDILIDKQYFEEMEEQPSIFDLLTTIAIVLKQEIKEKG